MSSPIARKITFARQKKVRTFMSRFNQLAARESDHNRLVNYAYGVCVGNRTIIKGFVNALTKVAPDVARDVNVMLSTREQRTPQLKSVLG